MYQKKIRFIFGLVAALSLLMPFNSTSSAQGIEAKMPLKIVQLGDSYSAGNGARDKDTGERNYYGVEGCYRSPTNWGEQYANSLRGEYDVEYINSACSGGVIQDIVNERKMDGLLDFYIKTPIESCRSADYPGEEKWKETSPTNCSRYLYPQINAINSSVDLVLMTMGGNDVKFDKIVLYCFATGFRDPTPCKLYVEQAKTDLVGVEEDLFAAFMELRGKLRKDAKIVFVTYPYLVPDVDYTLIGLDPIFKLPVFYKAAEEIRALGLAGDVHQRAAVNRANEKAGEKFIELFDGTKDLFDAKGEHLPHPFGHLPNPFQLQPRNPDRWINEFETSPFYVSEWYHPNPLGHENWAGSLSSDGTFGATGGSFGTNADIDVAFVVDTTGSMGGEIAQVRADLSSLVGQLAATTDSYRVAVVSYRDFPERTGDYRDYPFSVIQTFTEDPTLIQVAIDSLTLGYGGDGPETVFSGIQAAIELPWRPGVTKISIVIGDAPALSPEPISNLTADQIVANSIAVDPVQVIGVDTGSLNSNGALGQIADGTGGSVISGTSGLTTTISEILDTAVNQPFAWIGQAYSGKIGQPILFDASGSYDPSGLQITLYEWDFDGDGVFDLETAEATATHVYDAAFNDFVVLRVTGAGGTALASARTVVNAEGFASQGDEAPCALDENGFSIIIDEDGQFIRCTADSLPEVDQEGVREISGSTLPTPPDTTGVFRPSNGLLYLKNTNITGFADVAINYGLGGDYPVTGDWDGNGTATIGIYRNGSFYLRNSNTLGFADMVFAFGQPGDQPVAGDWNGDGTDTIGIYRPSTGQFLLRDSNSAGAADYSFYLGNVGDVGIAGDWTAKGFDTVGVFRPSNGIIFLKNTNQTGFADIALNYGLAGDQPVTGDWDGNGTDTIGVYRNAQFLLRNSNTIGFADMAFYLGNPGDMPIAGDWDGIP